MVAIRSLRACKKQLGQALPIGIAAILFTTILTLTLFNTGQVTSKKMRVTNAADAATYSGLVWQARALNLQAYTNRAMVANQVSIAQIVSLVSWSKYLKILARNLNNTIGWFPPVKPWTQTIYNVSDKINDVVIGIAEFAIPIIDSLIGVLSVSQEAVHYATYATTQEVVREVIRRNDPTFELTNLGVGWLALNVYDWENFSKQYDDGSSGWGWGNNNNENGLLRKAAVIDNSRDAFTRSRGWGYGLPSLGIVKFKIVKEGETRLIRKSNDNGMDWEWKGKDDFSVHTKYWGCSWRGCGWRRSELPVGWGAAYVSTTNNDIDCDNSSWWGSDCPRWGAQNRSSERRADGVIDKINANYNGVRDYRDIADLTDQNKDPRLPLLVEVRTGGANVRTSTKIQTGSGNNAKGIGSSVEAEQTRNGIGRGMFRVNDGFAGAEISAVSKGEVYFRRPVKRADGKGEFGNLFNPYWDVHLTDPQNARIAAWATKGLVNWGDAGGAIGGAIGN
jgi:hypothetical protein